MTEEQRLTEKTLARLRALARGNNVPDDAFAVIESVENIYELKAALKLEPDLEISIKKGFGRPKGKDRLLLPSFAALQEEIDKERKNTSADQEWLKKAVAELEKTKGHGWGHDGAALTWSGQETFLAASENCPTCRGSAQAPCPECQGIGRVHCLYCDGRTQEPCPHCQTRREDPTNPGHPCYMCHGQGTIPCRQCQATGRMICERCVGKGYLPCPDCRGSGYLAQEVKLKKSAKVTYKLGPTVDYPSGLLRMVQRVGEGNLHLHAAISMRQGNEQAGEDPSLIFLTAKIPYADIKLRIKGKASLVSIFGNKGRMTGVPAFLDDALTAERDVLARARTGAESIDSALKARLFQEALTLVLQGKTHPNDLRRLYPVGLSGQAAQEIMNDLSRAVRFETQKARRVAAIIFVVLSTVFFAGLFFTPLFVSLARMLGLTTTYVFLATLPLAAIFKAWLFLTFAARRALQKRFHNNAVSARQEVGRTGYMTYGAIVAIYIVILLLAGVIPTAP